MRARTHELPCGHKAPDPEVDTVAIWCRECKVLHDIPKVELAKEVVKAEEEFSEAITKAKKDPKVEDKLPESELEQEDVPVGDNSKVQGAMMEVARDRTFFTIKLD